MYSITAASHLLLGRTGPDAGAVVLEQVLGAVLDAGGPIGVLAVRIPLPAVLDLVVTLHGRALLLAHAVVVEVGASLELLMHVGSSNLHTTTYSSLRSSAHPCNR